MNIAYIFLHENLPDSCAKDFYKLHICNLSTSYDKSFIMNLHKFWLKQICISKKLHILK